MKENQALEWKESWRDEFLRWICGFANAEGGVLHIGRDDKGRLVGLADAAKLLEEIPNKVRDLLGILVAVNLRQESGGEFIEITVDAYPHPISYRGHYFQRSGSTLQELKGAALDRFLLRRQGRTWDGVPIPGVKITDLSTAALQQFRELARASGRLEPADLRSSKAVLVEKLQLTEGAYLKRAAVLLFHEDPEKFVTGAFVKIGFFRSESDLAYHDTLHGNLFSQVARTLDLVRTKYLKAAITYQGIQRIERYPVPDAALREAILNALVHRDYAVGAPVQIRVYEDCLRIWNPCVLPEGWTVKTLLGTHPSTPFNPALANVFFRSGEHRMRRHRGSLPQAARRARRVCRARQIETWGRGIERIFTTCKEAGTPKPKLTLDGTGLALEFRYAPEYLKAVNAPKSVAAPVAGEVTGEVTGEVAGEVTGEVARFLNALGDQPLSREEAQSQLQLKSQANFRDRYLMPALTLGLIERTLPNKPNSRLQKYRLTAQGRAWLSRKTAPGIVSGLKP